MKHWTQRNGVWVESDQGVGLRLIENGEWWIHLVNPDGTTLAQIPAARCANVVIARRESIPVARIAHLKGHQLAALGYT